MVILLGVGGGLIPQYDLVESTWKIITSIINRKLVGGITLYYNLHGFWGGQGKGTYIMNTNMVQRLAVINITPLLYISGLTENVRCARQG